MFLGNEFSTLEGLEFIWSVESSSGKGENVKLFKFRDSKLIDSFEPDLIALEAKGLQGSKVLLEGKQNTNKHIIGYFYILNYSKSMLQTFLGIRTGSSKVSVRLASKSYSDVPPAEVTVMVVANLFLVPNFAFVMNGATVHYHAERSLSESNGVSFYFRDNL